MGGTLLVGMMGIDLAAIREGGLLCLAYNPTHSKSEKASIGLEDHTIVSLFGLEMAFVS